MTSKGQAAHLESTPPEHYQGRISFNKRNLLYLILISSMALRVNDPLLVAHPLVISFIVLESTFLQNEDRNIAEEVKTKAKNIWALGDVNGGPQFTYISLDDFRIVKDQLVGDGSYTKKNRSNGRIHFCEIQSSHIPR